ncbi:FAST kinase domain-containing protein 2, mitochondrial isoform 1-T1 [Spinachia spinachia]
MFVQLTGVLVRCVLSECRLRSLWQQRRFLLTTSVIDKPFRNEPILSTRQKPTCVDISSVRFSSRGGIDIEDAKVKTRLSSPAGESSLCDEIQPGEPGSGQTPRPRWPVFIDHLQLCRSPSDVLDLTTKFSPTLRQVSHCLSRMWSTTRKMSAEQRRYELQLMFEHPAFDPLLKKAMKRVGDMHSENVIYCLLYMVHLGVPQGSRVVQTFLRSCLENLNDFDEKELSILTTCMEYMEDSTNVTLLRNGLRFVVEARLPGIKTVMALQNSMLLFGKDAPWHLKQRLEAKALSMADHFSLPNTLYMISTMASMGFYSKPLLDLCSGTIQENLHGIPFNRLFKVLRSCRDLQYKNFDLLTSISEHVAYTWDIWTKKQVVLLLSAMEHLSFCPAAIMDTFAKNVSANPDTLTLEDLCCILKVYSSLNHDLKHQRKPFLESLSQALDSYLPKMAAVELLMVVYHFCLLGHFPPAPLEQLLQSSTLEKFHTTVPRFLRKQERMFQMVNLCLRLEPALLHQPATVPPFLLGAYNPIGETINPMLSQGLQRVLEDQADTTLHEMVVVEDFYRVDAVITKPLPHQTSQTEASGCAEEECTPAERSQRIAVICKSRSALCHGTFNPRGPLALKIRHLKILGYEPVLIITQDLNSQEDQTVFLREQIFPEHLSSDTQSKVKPQGC